MAIPMMGSHGRGIEGAIPVLLLTLCGYARLATCENHCDQILRNQGRNPNAGDNEC